MMWEFTQTSDDARSSSLAFAASMLPEFNFPILISTDFVLVSHYWMVW